MFHILSITKMNIYLLYFNMSETVTYFEIIKGLNVFIKKTKLSQLF